MVVGKNLENSSMRRHFTHLKGKRKIGNKGENSVVTNTILHLFSQGDKTLEGKQTCMQIKISASFKGEGEIETSARLG